MKNIGYFLLGSVVAVGSYLPFILFAQSVGADSGSTYTAFTLLFGMLLMFGPLVLWSYLGFEGWDSTAHPVLKLIGLWFVLIIPLINFVGIFWIGRGAARLAARMRRGDGVGRESPATVPIVDAPTAQAMPNVRGEPATPDPTIHMTSAMPDTVAQSASVSKVAQTPEPARPSDVDFVREERKSVMPGVTRTYRIYRAPDAAAAVAFLAQNAIMKMHEYSIVETPEGNFGRDISGMFDESTGGAIPARYFQGIQHGTLSFFAASGLSRAYWIQTEAIAHVLGAGGRTGESHRAQFLPVDPKGEVIAAIFPQLPAGDYEVQTNFMAPMKATVRPGQVTELNKSF